VRRASQHHRAALLHVEGRRGVLDGALDESADFVVG
jgi:hypothetical protein